MLGAIDRSSAMSELQPAAYHALDEHYKTALNMITAPETKRAFEIRTENPKLRDRYGRTRFGQGCLLARRLIEAGVRFVTVTDTGWDTHQNNFPSLKKRLVPPIDRGLAAVHCRPGRARHARHDARCLGDRFRQDAASQLG